MNIEFAASSDADIEEIAEWWEAHRDVGAERFLRELEEAAKTLLANPEIGTAWRRRRSELVRRWLLEDTHYHVYYVYRVEQQQLLVLTIWGAKRTERTL